MPSPPSDAPRMTPSCGDDIGCGGIRRLRAITSCFDEHLELLDLADHPCPGQRATACRH